MSRCGRRRRPTRPTGRGRPHSRSTSSPPGIPAASARAQPSTARGRPASRPSSDVWTFPCCAVGVDPLTGRSDEGLAVRGASEFEVLALGARYGQDAVYAWTPAEWAIVACRSGRRMVSGWSLAGPAAQFPFSRTPGEPMR